MKGIPTTAAQRSIITFLRAFTLVEVMVSMVIFAMSAVGLTSLFLQNLRYSTWQTQNVHITNTTFGIADQIKNMGANAIWAAFKAAGTATPLTLNVTTVDPSDLNVGYKTVALYINQADIVNADGTVTATAVNPPDWNNVTLKLGRLATSPEIPVGYWITVRHDASAPGVTPAFDVLELTLIDRWSVGGKPMKTLNQIQLTFPAPNCNF